MTRFLSTTPSWLALGLATLLSTGCGAAKMRAAGAMAAPASEAPIMSDASRAGFSDVNTDKALNTDGHVRTWTDTLLLTSSSFRSQVYELGGFVRSERVDYGDKVRALRSTLPTRAPQGERNKAVFSVSIPIERVPELLDWIRSHTRIVEQYVKATRDTSLPNPEVVAANQADGQASLEKRLEALITLMSQDISEEERSTLETERLQIARKLAELSRNAVAITEPTVKYATLNVYLESERPQARFSSSRFVPTVRSTLLVTNLLGSKSERETRVGGAIGVALPYKGSGGMLPSPLLEVAGYPATGEHDAGVIATMGTGQYARSSGDGESRWFNPFAGARMGYAHIDRNAFVVSGEIGVEVFKTSGVALSASVRPSAFIGKDSQVVLESGSTLSLAF